MDPAVARGEEVLARAVVYDGRRMWQWAGECGTCGAEEWHWTPTAHPSLCCGFCGSTAVVVRAWRLPPGREGASFNPPRQKCRGNGY